MLLGFKKQFAPKILDGSKKFTIRNPRKREPKIGEQLHMYTGLRTKHTAKISSEHSLKGIRLVNIFLEKRVYHQDEKKSKFSIGIQVDGSSLSLSQTENFVTCDGFDSTEEFMEYWIKEKGEKKEYFTQGKKDPIFTMWTVEAHDLVLYRWAEIIF